MYNKTELFNTYINKNISNIKSFSQDKITYWLELEYILVDNNYIVKPKSANAFLKNNNEKIISWESWTFQLEISSNYYELKQKSLDLLLSNIKKWKSKINDFCFDKKLNCISIWLPPYINKNYDKNINYLNQDDKYNIERKYWLNNRNDSYKINKDFVISDSCANLALVNWIHINIKLRNIQEFIDFHNIWVSLMPFLYWLSSNASFCNWKIKWKKGVIEKKGWLK